MQDSPATQTDVSTATTDDDPAADADRTAIVVARDADQQPDTTEIERLASAAGYAVVDAITQRRREDGQYNVGRGKAEELARRVAETGADAALFDVELTPGQYSALTGLLPDGVRIIDRHRLVLDIFETGAGGKAARLQVELAKLRYELPRVRETEERTHMQRAAETGSRVVDIESRIRTVETKLDRLADRANERRAERREQGFDLVAIAGYTNAGKSTLLHRLADDLSVEGMEPDHADLDGVAEVEDRLFKTLDTTTRRATVDGRRVLLTDTVGLVDGIPHDLVAAFSTTLSAVADSDAALLVVDASDDREGFREKLRVSLDELGHPRGELLIVLNKADLVDDGALAARREVVEEVAGDRVTEVLPVSALAGTGTDRLRDVVGDVLPDATAVFDLPNTGETQSFLAWAHEHGRVDADYTGNRVHVTFSARPAVVERARSEAATVETDDGV
ncbi:GTPase HflX [Halolamina salifodinae]|uniref:GTP-binding protein HflX n=1 Tax=Halolamina salifodinae TaxID=1202767 RepID=A0A8T4GUX5_9EURY|nr:GTPase HflX [Halolamina salifodinae]MBP1986696.1 GTP-binding protein HflX [Halolamina salifodinae]